jgi:hypothetical protein
MTDRDAKQMMLGIAEDYEKLAKRPWTDREHQRSRAGRAGGGRKRFRYPLENAQARRPRAASTQSCAATSPRQNQRRKSR